MQKTHKFRVTFLAGEDTNNMKNSISSDCKNTNNYNPEHFTLTVD